MSEVRAAKLLSEKIEVDAATMSRWRNNHTQPLVLTLDKMAAMLGVSIRDLLNE